jgi:phage terminase small subunit
MAGNKNSGRRPQPTALKILRGNPGKRALNALEPVPPTGAISMPRTLSTSARRVWRRLAPIAIAMRTLTRADVTAFAMLCELQATLERAALRKNRAKTFLSAIAIERAFAPIIRPYYALFGLEPVSRARIQVPTKAEPEPVSKWAGALK